MGLFSLDRTGRSRFATNGERTPLLSPHTSTRTDLLSDSEDKSENTSCTSTSERLQGLASAPSIKNHQRAQYADRNSCNSSTGSDTLQPEVEQSEKPASWSSLPKKGQLAILTLARLSEGLTQSSLQAYLFHQLSSFNPSLPASSVSAQVGIMLGIFPAAQFFTSTWWGRLADAGYMGRKRVLLIGLMGSMISYLAFGFSRSLATAAICRVFGGLLNCNVGVMSTIISDIIVDKKFQSRAFLLLPMCFNVGVIIGPIMGGSLADPVHNFPHIFGKGSILGGEEGVWWMQNWPFALPNILSSIFIFMSFLAVFFGLDETHEITRHRYDLGRDLGRKIAQRISQQRPEYSHPSTRASDENCADQDTSLVSAPPNPASSQISFKSKLRENAGFKKILTRNVVLTLLCHFLLSFHTNAVQAMIFIFLPNPRAPTDTFTDMFHFSGGLGLPSAQVGIATAIIGFTGLPLQIFVYPRLQHKLGTLLSLRTFLPLSAVSYILMPFLVLLPRIPGVFWPALTFVIILKTVSRTFILPATTILINNSVSDPSSLGTIHGIAQSISSAARTLGPIIGGWGIGVGLKNNMVGAMWWALGAEAIIGWLMLWCIYEGEGAAKDKMDEEEEI